MCTRSRLIRVRISTYKQMASSTAIEGCEHSFSSPCLQVSCLHDAPSTKTTEPDEREQESIDVSSLNRTTASLPDPLVIMKPCSEANASTRFQQGGSGRTIDNREPDKYVLMRCYRPGDRGDSRFKVFVSETPVLITDLRPLEQNIAYGRLLENARGNKINEYYGLHLLRLMRFRESIVVSEIAMDELRKYHVQHLKRLRRLRIARLGGKEATDGGSEEEGGLSHSENERVEQGFWAYQRALKERERLRALERGVKRLLVRCEDAGRGVLGFREVEWEAS